MSYDFLVIGGGIVGLSTAWQLQGRLPDRRIAVLEKEPELAGHQSGRNSGVIHSGIYYRPGSLKARFCREGSQATFRFCQQHDIPHERRGKLLVAHDERGSARLGGLLERARERGIDASLVGRAQLEEIEPNVTGLRALSVPAAGIVDFRRVAWKMAELFRSLGGEIRLGTQVNGMDEREREVLVHTSNGTLASRYVIGCAGLMADRVAGMAGITTDFRIVPFRGEYFRLAPERSGWVRALVYPVPDPALPFLGVHLTPRIDGSITVGPNAVLALKREGYHRTDVAWRDLKEMVAFGGFWRALVHHFGTGLSEARAALSKRSYLSRVRAYSPALTMDDLIPHPAGVRAQAVAGDGTLVDDFLFASTRRMLHVCNAPSPAATSAIPIGQHIVREVQEHFS